MVKCNECHQEIKNEDELHAQHDSLRDAQTNELINPEAVPYHKTCWEKNQREWHAHLDKKREELQAKEDEKKREEDKKKYGEIALKLAKREGFLASAKEFLDDQPMFYDKGKNWWLWEDTTKCWRLVDETDILNVVRISFNLFGDVTIKSRNNMLEALKQVAREQSPKEFPKTWVQFQCTIIDLATGKGFESTPEYFSTNPIPWEIGDSEETPIIDQIFQEWIEEHPGEPNKETLYQILAYCLLSDYPLNVLFCLHGGGSNGKTKFLQLIERFIGKDNISSAELEALCDPQNKFEKFKLYKKLVCLVGETNFDLLKSTSNIKRLTGQDLISFEAKNKDAISEYNYAKIILSTNGLPSSNDQSAGFYRRWVIIDFPNQFTEGQNPLDRIPKQEYLNLARKSVRILREILKTGIFTGQGSVETRQKRYIARSNPLLVFLEECCVCEESREVLYSTLYTRYVSWLKQAKRRIVSRQEFSKLLESEGHEIRKTSVKVDGGFKNGTYVLGLGLKLEITDYAASNPVVPVVPHFPIPSMYTYAGGKVGNNEHNEHKTIFGIFQELLKKNGGELEMAEAQRCFPELNFDKLLQEGTINSPRAGIIRWTS